MERYPKPIEDEMRAYYDSLNEKDRRRYAAIEAMKLGWGGQRYISEILLCDPKTISRGQKELVEGSETPPDRIRIEGGGRKKVIDSIQNIDTAFLEVIEDHTAGDPMHEDIKWTNLTLKEISEHLRDRGVDASEHVVKQLLDKHGFVKRKAQKKKTMKESDDRDEQFENIDRLKKEYMSSANPIISVDTKKKEHIGNFYRDGSLYTQETIEVYDHDFNSFADGVIIPHGIYDCKANKGYVTLGTTHDTAEFACDNIRRWWESTGKKSYPDAESILMLVDGGGSNSSRHYIFKLHLQKLSDTLGIEIRVAHYPPYTSKYNPIEHRMFCHVTRACKGVVFSSIEVVKELIEKTRTSKGLRVIATINDKIYETSKKVSDDFKENMKIIFDDHLAHLNYRAVPQLQ